MRYYSIQYPDINGKDVTETLSEHDIMATYFPFWYKKMCDKYGKTTVNNQYTWEDCLDDWITVNWAVKI